METSDVRRLVQEMMRGAKRKAGERRTRVDRASRDWDDLLNRMAVPLARQVAAALTADGYPFTVSTPGASVRLTPDRSADDFVELLLETAGPEPHVLGHAKRSRGRRIIETERRVAPGEVQDLTEEAVLNFLLEELELMIDR